MKPEITDAINLLKSEGYAVIARENVKTLESTRNVIDEDAYRFRNEDGWLRRIKYDLYHGLSNVLADDGICAISTAQAIGLRGTTTYRARLTVIPHEVAIDPILEAIRKS